jgi:tetratricopeptide (TPR) repeat protein
VVAGMMALALLAGLALARGVGQRGGGELTGDVGGVREQLAACQPLAFQEPKKGIGCYQKILQIAPDDLDALTYQGWAMVRAGRPGDGAKKFARVVELDPTYPDVRVFRAVLASRAEEWDAAASEVDLFFKNDPPPVATQVLQQQGLEFKVFIGLQPPATQACWVAAAQGLDPKVGFDQAFIDRLSTCLDKVLSLDPDDPQARFSRALASIGPDRQDLATAERLLDQLLAEEPDNANALLLKARIDLAAGRVDAAELQAARLGELSRPTAAFLVGEPKDLLAAVRQSRTARSTTSTTSKSATVSTVPGAPAIPNAGGG